MTASGQSSSFASPAKYPLSRRPLSGGTYPPRVASKRSGGTGAGAVPDWKDKPGPEFCEKAERACEAQRHLLTRACSFRRPARGRRLGGVPPKSGRRPRHSRRGAPRRRRPRTRRGTRAQDQRVLHSGATALYGLWGEARRGARDPRTRTLSSSVPASAFSREAASASRLRAPSPFMTPPRGARMRKSLAPHHLRLCWTSGFMRICSMLARDAIRGRCDSQKTKIVQSARRSIGNAWS